MLTAEQNYRLLQEIEANRVFILMAYRQNPKLLERAEPRIRQLFAGSNERDPPGGGGLLEAHPSHAVLPPHRLNSGG
jgi:hypothetical protein